MPRVLCSSRPAGIYFEMFDSEIDADNAAIQDERYRHCHTYYLRRRGNPNGSCHRHGTQAVLQIDGRATRS